MTDVKYRCKVHGKFAVSLDIGGRCRRGSAPPEHPCPTCGQACKRARHKTPGIALTHATIEAIKVFCQRTGLSHAQAIEQATRSDSELQAAAAKIRWRRGERP